MLLGRKSNNNNSLIPAEQPYWILLFRFERSNGERTSTLFAMGI